MWQNILGFFEVLLLSICLDAFKPRIKEGKACFNFHSMYIPTGIRTFPGDCS